MMIPLKALNEAFRNAKSSRGAINAFNTNLTILLIDIQYKSREGFLKYFVLQYCYIFKIQIINNCFIRIICNICAYTSHLVIKEFYE